MSQPRNRVYQILVDSGHKNSANSNTFDFQIRLPETLHNVLSIELRDAIFPFLMFPDGDFVYMHIKEVPGQFIVPQHSENTVETSHITHAFTRLPLKETRHHFRSVFKGAHHMALMNGKKLNRLSIKLYKEDGTELVNSVTNLTNGEADYKGAYIMNRTHTIESQDSMSKVELTLEYDGSIPINPTLSANLVKRSAAEDVFAGVVPFTNRYVMLNGGDGQSFRVLAESLSLVTGTTYTLVCWLPTAQVAGVTEGTDPILVSLTGPAISTLECQFLFHVTVADHENFPHNQQYSHLR